MNKEVRVPLPTLQKEDFSLLYFDINCIERPGKIYKAYIFNCCNYYDGSEAEVFLNKYLPDADKKSLDCQTPTVPKDSNYGRIIADVTDTVKMIVSGYVPNHGIILKNVKYLYTPYLTILYFDEVIYPRCECNIFFEREFELTRYSVRVESPWFYSGNSKTITFFIENRGNCGITAHIENSPNTRNITEDAQRLRISPSETADITPYKFSKFMRITAVSDFDTDKTSCAIWFQTQLII